jgi:hypothetical protein
MREMMETVITSFEDELMIVVFTLDFPSRQRAFRMFGGMTEEGSRVPGTISEGTLSLTGCLEESRTASRTRTM